MILFEDESIEKSEEASNQLRILSTNVMTGAASAAEPLTANTVKVTDILLNIVRGQLSQCITWLRVNEYNENNFEIDEIMDITDEDIKEARQTLANLY